MIEKIFFQPGDLVTLKQDIPNKPVMIVVKKETKTFKVPSMNNSIEYFRGIKCRWFTTIGEMQESIWNTKDLIKVD